MIDSNKLTKLIHNFINAHRLNEEDVIINFGSAMVFWGLRDTCNDIDMCVQSNHYLTLKTMYQDDIRGGDICQIQTMINVIDGKSVAKEYLEIQFQGHVLEVHVEDFNQRDYVQIDTHGLQVDNLQQLLRDKQRLNRPKDQDDIQLIKTRLLTQYGVTTP